MGHSGIEGNENADEFPRQGSLTPYTKSEAAVGISETMGRIHPRNGVRAKHRETWENLPSSAHGRTFIKEPSKNTEDFTVTVIRADWTLSIQRTPKQERVVYQRPWL